MNKHRFKTTTAALLTALMLLPHGVTTLAAEAYNDNFRDVARTDWFYDSVAEAYSMGIIDGVSATEYAPDATLDLAASIKLACCVHQQRKDGAITLGNGTVNWYDTYVAYAMENGILTEPYADYTAPASRAQVAVIFSRVLSPEEAKLNADDGHPLGDVKDPSLWYYSSVYKMYAYGIMTGDDKGNFNPEGKIKRSEIAAVVVRLLDSSRRVTVDPAGETPPAVPPAAETPSVEAGAPLSLHKGGTENIPFTGLTGFSVVYDKGSVTGYSAECINDVVLATETLTFRLKKDVGITAMGIVRGWLKNAASSNDGTPSEKSAEELKEALNSRFALYVNGRKAGISSLAITADAGDLVYTFTLAAPCATEVVSHAVLVCGEIPDTYTNEAKTAIEGARSLPDPFASAGAEAPETTEPTPPAVPPSEDDPAYLEAVAYITDEGSEILFEHETDRLKVFYTVQGSAYRLRFVYRDGTVQEISSAKLTNIRVNDDGTVLYYAVPTPDGESMEYGVSIGTPKEELGSADGTSKDTADLKGRLSGLNITLSAQDKKLIALMAGEDDVLFRGVYSNYEVAFDVVLITPATFFKIYADDFPAESHNRIFALKDGNYYAVLYGNADERTREAAERVIASVVTENTFDIVYSPADESPSGGTYLYLSATDTATITGDPFLFFKDSTADNGYRIENTEETKDIYQISPDCEVWVLAMDVGPVMKTTYSQFQKIWPLGSKWPVWRAVIDPDTRMVTKLIQQYLP